MAKYLFPFQFLPTTDYYFYYLYISPKLVPRFLRSDPAVTLLEYKAMKSVSSPEPNPWNGVPFFIDACNHLHRRVVSLRSEDPSWRSAAAIKILAGKWLDSFNCGCLASSPAGIFCIWPTMLAALASFPEGHHESTAPILLLQSNNA